VPCMTHPQSVVGGAYIIRPSIAVRPVRGGYQARADMPWHWREHLEDKPTPTDYAMTSLHTAPTASTALTGAIDGSCYMGLCGGYADDEHVSRLACIADACEGAPFEELAEVYGEEDALAAQQVVGSFFSHLNPMHLATSLMHNPLTSMAANFVPGGRAALDAANMFGGGGGGGGGAPHPFPGMAAAMPAGSPSHRGGRFLVTFD
jgi:hypothetical protein